MGHHVICLEPYYDNVLRIHKASHVQNIQDKIILLNNAISSKRNELKFFKGYDNNLNSPSHDNNKTYVRGDNPLLENYLAETILLDDIVKYIPKRENRKRYKKAVLKMDLDSFEVYAILYGKKFFKKIDIQVIYMEWGLMLEQQNLHVLIEKMIEFLITEKYNPFDQTGPLKVENWKKWPWNVIWKR